MSTQPPGDSFPAGAVTRITTPYPGGLAPPAPPGPDGLATLAAPAPDGVAPPAPLPASTTWSTWPRASAPGGVPGAAPAATGTTVAPRKGPRPAVLWGGAAGAVFVFGLVLVLVLVATGRLGSGRGPFSGNAAPPDVRPPLARLCPPPSAFADPTGSPLGERSPSSRVPGPSGPSGAANGARTTDPDAGISYPRYGAPWVPWPYLWRAGTLGVPYGVGQHFVTETYLGGSYHASILSAAVPATVNDGLTIDVECTGRQVAADVRAEYYPVPNTMELLRDELVTVGGLEAWVTTFRLRFDQRGLAAKDELVGLAVIDVGRPTAAVLFISIPGTHRQWDYVVDEVLASVRPA